MLVTREQFKTFVPGASEDWPGYIAEAATAQGYEFTAEELAALLAQCAYETSGFTRFEENLNYSAARLGEVWPRKFPVLGIAEQYAHSADKLANYIYANRFGNGDEASGDGFKYRGRGLLMTTFRDNYEALGKRLGIDLIGEPSTILDPKVAARAAVNTWIVGDLKVLNFVDLTHRINGGLTGLAGRENYHRLARQALGLSPCASAAPADSDSASPGRT